MTKRELTRWAIGGGMAVALCASTLPAQVDTTRRDTTRARSTTRIPIRKEAGGEVVLPRARQDSIAMQARRDSMTRADLARNDSIAAAERARQDSINMVTRADSIAQAARMDSIARLEQARTDSIARLEQMRNDSIARANATTTQSMTMNQGRRLPGSFYMGLAAGAASPQADIEDLGYDSGLNISVPIGWHNPAALFGWRLMLGYSQFNGASFTTLGANPVVLSNADPKVYSAELNLNMRFPFNERRTSSVYLTGGGGVYMFRNFGRGSALAGYLGNDVLDPDDSENESTINKWGLNGGAGLEFGIGSSSLFLETRLVNVFAGRDDEPNFDSVFGERGTSVRWVPLILGFTIR
ncbi:MAG TPA: outer membrane beta-barrel protein [Gemmatimonadaceae bacterium]